MKNVWIFGGTGFIGSALVDILNKSDDYLQHILIHRKTPFQELESNSLFSGNLENFDLSWLELYPPNVIFHLARLGGSNAFSRKLSSYIGMKANERIINYLLRKNLNPIIVYVSGSLMYGNRLCDAPAYEDCELNPISYARYYYTAEKPWILAQSDKILDVRFARPGWILGPDSWFKYYFWNYYKRTGKVPVYGLGAQQMSIIMIDDCARQILNLAEKGNSFQNLNVSSGQVLTQMEFSNIMANILNCKIENLPFPKTRRLHGLVTAEALTSSIPLLSNYTHLSEKRIEPAETMLKSVISLLKNKEGIFPKTPQKSFV